MTQRHMGADDTMLTPLEKNVLQIEETLQLCHNRISVWCNANHILINPVKNEVNDNHDKSKTSDFKRVIQDATGRSNY